MQKLSNLFNTKLLNYTTLVFIVFLILREISVGRLDIDAGYFLNVSRKIAHGEFPIMDYSINYPPVAFYVFSIPYLLFKDPNDLTIRIFNACLVCITLILTHTILKKSIKNIFMTNTVMIAFSMFLASYISEIKIELVICLLFITTLYSLQIQKFKNSFIFSGITFLLVLLTKQYALILFPVFIIITSGCMVWENNTWKFRLNKLTLASVYIWSGIFLLILGFYYSLPKWDFNYMTGTIVGCKSYGVNWKESHVLKDFFVFLKRSFPFLLLILLMIPLIKKSGIRVISIFGSLILIALAPLYFQFFNHYLTYVYLVIITLMTLIGPHIENNDYKIRKFDISIFLFVVSLFQLFRIDAYVLRNFNSDYLKQKEEKVKMTTVIKALSGKFGINENAMVYPEIRDKQIWYYGAYTYPSKNFGFHYLDGISKECFIYCSHEFNKGTFILCRRRYDNLSDFDYLGNCAYGEQTIFVYKKTN